MAIKMRRNSILSIALILCMLLGLLSSTTFADGPTDRTNETGVFFEKTLAIGPAATAKVIMVDNVVTLDSDEITAGLSFTSGTAFHLTAVWGAANTAGWKAGDYLIFDLPMSDIIAYAAESGYLNRGYGTWEIYNAGDSTNRDYKVKFTLTAAALEGTALTNGEFSTERRFRDMGTGGETGTTHLDDTTSISWAYTETPTAPGPFSRSYDDMAKSNWGFAYGTNTVTYVLRMNEQITRERYEALANASPTYSPPAPREHVMVVDELPPALIYAGTVSFNMSLRGPYDSSGTTVQSNDTDYRSIEITNRTGVEITQDTDESYTAFYDRVKISQAPCYGIFDSKTFIINLGEVGGSVTFKDTYNGLFGTGYSTMEALLKAVLPSYGTESGTERATRWIDETGGASGVFSDDMNIWGYTFTIRTKAVWEGSEEFLKEKSIENTATMTYDTGGSNSGSNSAAFYRSSASIQLNPGEMYLVKVDAGDADVRIPGTVFSIAEYTGGGATLDEVIADTDPDNWDALPGGTTGDGGVLTAMCGENTYFKVVEVIAANGYNADSFVLYDEWGAQLAGGVFYIPNGASIKLVATNEKLPAELSLAGMKELAGRALRDGEFTFEVVDDGGIVVTTGKNDANGNIIFNPVLYTAADEGNVFTYTVREVEGNLTGVTYDKTGFMVTVTIHNEQAFVDYPAGGIVFKNTYRGGGTVNPSNPGPDPDPQPVPNPEPQPGPNPEPNPEPNPGPNPEPDPQPDPGPDPDPQPNPDPVPNPDPTEPYAPGGTDPSVPPLPTVPGHTLIQDDDGWIELDENGIPLGRWEWDEEEEMWVLDEDIPLGGLPYTGGDGLSSQLFFLMGAFLLTMGMALRVGKRKHGKGEQN